MTSELERNTLLRTTVKAGVQESVSFHSTKSPVPWPLKGLINGFGE
jgi:hypothetical protein